MYKYVAMIACLLAALGMVEHNLLPYLQSGQLILVWIRNIVCTRIHIRLEFYIWSRYTVKFVSDPWYRCRKIHFDICYLYK